MARSKNGEAIGARGRSPSARKKLRRFIRQQAKSGDLDQWRRGRAILGYIEPTLFNGLACEGRLAWEDSDRVNAHEYRPPLWSDCDVRVLLWSDCDVRVLPDYADLHRSRVWPLASASDHENSLGESLHAIERGERFVPELAMTEEAAP